MIQVALRSVECVVSCGASARGRHRVTAEVVTRYNVSPQTHALGGAGLEYDPETGPRTLPEADWAYEDHEPNLYSGFPMKVIVRVTHVESGRVEVAELRIPRPAGRQWRVVSSSVVVRVEMRVPVLTARRSLRGADGRFHFGFGEQHPEDVFAFRGQSDEYLTVSMQHRRVRVEVNPVYPHWANPVQRPEWCVNTGQVVASSDDAMTSSAPNSILNPAVIPRIQPATIWTGAKVGISEYFPAGLNLEQRDRRLRWRAIPLTQGAEVQFLGDPATCDKGHTVVLSGVADGEVQLELLFNEHRVALYRALVKPIVRIPYRVILLRCAGRDDFAPESMLAEDMVRVNRVLRQVCVELVPDTSSPRRPDIRSTDAPGIYVMNVPPADTIDVNSATALRVARIDARQLVLNIVVVRSRHPSVDWQGLAGCWPESTASGHVITDRGTPGTSWIGSTGIPPSTAPHEARLSIFGASPPTTGDADGPLACVTVAADLAYYLLPGSTRAVVIAHEIGHVMNLRHRAESGDPYPDGLPGPPYGNVMNPAAVASCTDLDIAQARAIWASRLVTHYLANPLPEGA